MQDFTLVISISPDGETVEGEVQGMKGRKCHDVQKMLNDLGEELEHRHTPDWDKREPVSTGTGISRTIKIGR